MLEQLQHHLDHHFPFLKDKKLLLAVSGGVDSVVMAELFQKLQYKISIAHCNFQLRGVESFDDEKFVTDYADTHRIPVYTTKFDTATFAKDYKISIQLAARELRYNWFYELIETGQYDYILTAHHADDNLETFLINLSRGTGLDGLTGIPVQNDKVIRPMMCFSRIDIGLFANENGLEWREDSSNASDKYLRNKIRHELVPVLMALNPNFMDSFQNTQSYLSDAKSMADDAAIMVYQQVASVHGNEIHFDLKKLKQLPNSHAYLYQWLREFNFTAWSDIYKLMEANTGKQILSTQFRLFKSRNVLVVSPRIEEEETVEYKIDKDMAEVNFPLKMLFCKVDEITHGSNSIIFVDESKLEFPMIIRKRKQGDRFQPCGMEGQTKKVSKFFKDEKLSLTEKEITWLLCSGNQIVWIIGHRQDERFKVTDNTNTILKIAAL